MPERFDGQNMPKKQLNKKQEAVTFAILPQPKKIVANK